MRITARLMNGTRRRSAVMIATIAMAVSASTLSAAQAYDWPKFRKGMWRFERTLEIGGGYVVLPAASRLLWKREMTRCVDPSEAMKETFRPVTIGNCRSAEPQLVKNRYVFPLRCDYMGPVRTVIAVESDGAYTEINELSVGNFPRIDTVIARRVGECEVRAEGQEAARPDEPRRRGVNDSSAAKTAIIGRID